MANQLKTLNMRRASLLIADGAAKSIELAVEEGQLTFTEATELEYVKVRGKLAGCNEGDEVPLALSFDVRWGEQLSRSNTTAGLKLRNLIYGDSFTSEVDPFDEVTFTSVEDACGSYAVNITLTAAADQITGCEMDEKILFAAFSVEKMNYQPKDRKISVSGICSVSRAVFSLIA